MTATSAPVARSKEDIVEQFRMRSILEGALRVIARRGVAAATMQDVADEAGIAKGTINLYFESRDELVRRVAEEAFSRLEARLAEALSTPGHATVRLRRLVETKIAFFDDHRELFRAYLAACQAEAGAASRRRPATYDLHLRRLVAFLEAAMAAGELRRADAERLALFVSEGITAVVRRRLSEPEPPPARRDVEWIASMLLDGLSAGPRSGC